MSDRPTVPLLGYPEGFNSAETFHQGFYSKLP
jgi:hypothetical protein